MAKKYLGIVLTTRRYDMYRFVVYQYEDMLMKTGLLCAASGSTMTRSCRWRISTLDTPPLTSSNCAPQRKNTAPRKMNSCQVVRTG